MSLVPQSNYNFVLVEILERCVPNLNGEYIAQIIEDVTLNLNTELTTLQMICESDNHIPIVNSSIPEVYNRMHEHAFHLTMILPMGETIHITFPTTIQPPCYCTGGRR